MHSKEYKVEVGGHTITAVFSDLADQANGSVILKCEDTIILATAVISKSDRNNPGFFNLTVEYMEKFGKTPWVFDMPIEEFDDSETPPWSTE